MVRKRPAPEGIFKLRDSPSGVTQLLTLMIEVIHNQKTDSCRALANYSFLTHKSPLSCETQENICGSRRRFEKGYLP